MEAVVVHPKELAPAQIEQWDEIRRANPSLGSPFLSAGFARAVGAVRDDARVALLPDAFFAFQSHGDGAGMPIGATICDAQAVIAARDFNFDACELVHACGMSSWTFDHVITSQLPFVPFHASEHAAPVIDMSSGHDAYLGAVRAQSRDVLTQVARRRRKLEREVGPVTCQWNSTNPSDLTTLFAWKSAQYARTGEWDRFDQPWIEQLVRGLAEANDDPELDGVLTTLHAGDRLVAAHFGLRSGRRLSWWFPTYDPEFGRYSPGLALLLDLTTLACDRGIDLIDLGRGEHSYKLRVANRTDHVAQGVVHS